MSDTENNKPKSAANYQNSPLHGLGLNKLLNELVDHYGFEILFAYLNINCFKNNPSIQSSEKFLKKTQWAREKVESFYLYQYKSLPRATEEQFALSPRDRTIPEDQIPGEPAELSLEDAERLMEKRAQKAAERKNNRPKRPRSGKDFAAQRVKRREDRPNNSNNSSSNTNDSSQNSAASKNSSSTAKVDPWANARAKK